MLMHSPDCPPLELCDDTTERVAVAVGEHLVITQADNFSFSFDKNARSWDGRGSRNFEVVDHQFADRSFLSALV